MKWIALTGFAVVAVGGAFIWNEIANISSTVDETIQVVAPPPARTEVTREMLVRALQGKLEVTTLSLDFDVHVKAGVCDGNAYQKWAYSNCVTMFVPGKINAGIVEKKITVDKNVVTVNLGKPKIHDVVINHAKIEVLDQVDGALVFQDIQLQAQALAKADTELRLKACHDGILKLAALEAEKRVGDEFRSLFQQTGTAYTVKVVYDITTCT